MDIRFRNVCHYTAVYKRLVLRLSINTWYDAWAASVAPAAMRGRPHIILGRRDDVRAFARKYDKHDAPTMDFDCNLDDRGWDFNKEAWSVSTDVGTDLFTMVACRWSQAWY